MRERHGARVNLQDLQPRLRVGHADFDFAIESPGTPQRRIENFGNIGGADDDHLAARHETIHQAEQLRHHALFDFAGNFGALGSHRVDLVDKKNRGSAARRFFKHFAELGFALAVKLAHDFRAVQGNEVHAAFRRHGARQQGFSRARRAVQQHALRCENSQPLKNARVLQRQLDHFANARHFPFQPANIFVGHRRSAGRGLLALHDPDIGARSDHDRPRGNRAHHLEIHRLGKRRHAHHTALRDRNARQILDDPFGRDDRRRGANPHRRESHGHGLRVFDDRDRHLLLQAHAAIAARRAVDLDDAFV